jgi:translocation and assembly module TamA
MERRVYVLSRRCVEVQIARVLLAWLLLLLSSRASARAEAAACPGVIFEARGPDLTKTERRLVCGDPDSEAWKSVPRSQVRRLLTAFLQKRGYYYPVFTDRGPDLVVATGRRTSISRLSGSGFPPGVDLSKRRRLGGEPMTADMLDSISAAASQELQNRGIACPSVVLSADARTGEVRVVSSSAPVHVVEEIEEPSLPGIAPSIFRRFEAFERGKPMDRRLFLLTSDRVVSQALFLNSRYEVICGPDGARIVHRVAAAPSRLVRIGVGVDTEGLGHFRAQWQHSRIGARASTSETTLLASAREQSLESAEHLYVSAGSRFAFLPRAVVGRSDEPDYETAYGQISADPSITWDDQAAHVDLQAGPALQYVDTRRGIGPAGSTFLAFNAHAELTSHLFEFFQREPQRGSRVQLDTASRVAGVVSKVTAHRVRIGTEKLWNVGSFEPPLLVLSERDWAGTVWVRDQKAALAELPPGYRFFMGGDADYRGAGQQKLPGDAIGYFTAAYQSLELRLGDVLPYRLQPFVFTDAAMGGRTAFHLERDVYYAPGFGARWPTPFGAFRATVARSLFWRREDQTAPRPPRWQYFVSYGLEF